MSAEAPKETRESIEAKKLIEEPAISSEQPTVPVEHTGAPTWPELSADHPLAKFNLKLPELIAQATYGEVYGLDIDPASEKSIPFHRNLILQKFLRAEANDIDKAAEKLLETLKWRKEYKPLEARDAVFNSSKYGGLGYVTRIANVPGSPNKDDVATFNIYGAVTDNKSTFGDTESFLRWRVALMELSLQALKLDKAPTPIPDFDKGPDPYQGFQIHDYMGVSFLRQDPHVKAASKEAINTFAKYYPETLARKFFVNVPVLMGWMFGAMKMVLSAETTRKFTVVTYAKDLFKELGEGCPDEYGGKGGPLKEHSETTRIDV